MAQVTAVSAAMNFDRFLSHKTVSKRALQLVALGAILICSKIYEHNPPYISEVRGGGEGGRGECVPVWRVVCVCVCVCVCVESGVCVCGRECT